MNKKLIYLLLVAGFISVGLVSLFYNIGQFKQADGQPNPKISALKSQRLIVRFKDDRQLKRIAKRAGLKAAAFIKKPHSDFYVVQVTNEQKTRLIADQAVASTEIDEPVHIFLTPNDPKFSDQPIWSTLQAPTAWDVTTGSDTVTVASVDTGVNGQHEDLLGRVTAGYDYVNGRPISANTDSDDHGHGTQVAGVIAATGNNGKGIAGADWQAKIMPIKALDSTGTGSTADAASAIRYAADNGAQVVNLSFGRSTASTVLEEAVNYAWGKGVVLVAASGNDGAAAVSFPAAYNNVMAVGALDGETKANFSNYGPEIDVVAPGKSVLTLTDATDQYITVSGTSIAAPAVAGEISLVRGLVPKMSAAELKNYIETQVDKLSAMGQADSTNEYGKGRINYAKAVKNVVDYRYEIVDQNNFPTLIKGESYQFRLVVKNTGGATWKQSVVHLGTDRSMDRVPTFIREDRVNGNDSGWVSENRVKMQEAEVKPNATATFIFWYTVPNNKSPGIDREYFRPVADGVGWLADYGIYWDVKVLSEAETYQSQWVSQNAHPTLRRGQSYQFTVQFKNIGKATWRKGRVNLGTDRSMDRVPIFIREDIVTNQSSGWVSSNRVQMTNQEVKPGEAGTFNFWLSASATQAPGTYREYFRPVVEGLTWLEDWGVYWDVTVTE